jgi:hypothetical protein
MTGTRPFAAILAHGFVRICYQTMGITVAKIGTAPRHPTLPILGTKVDGGYGA